MAWWNRTSKPEDEASVEAAPGEIIPCDDPQKVVIVPKDPEPNLSTKPKDVVGYCFGFVCSKKHVSHTFETISIDRFKERRACPICGGISKPATVKRIAEAQWGDVSYRVSMFSLPESPEWGWYNSYSTGLGKGQWAPHDALWTTHEFVHYLESPKRRKK